MITCLGSKSLPSRNDAISSLLELWWNSKLQMVYDAVKISCSNQDFITLGDTFGTCN